MRQKVPFDKLAVGVCCALALPFAHGRSATVSLAPDPQAENALLVSFADTAGETNGLWVAYGGADCGATTNGWDHARFLRTVTPGTAAFSYALPEGWGESVRAIRFMLSEVPYDYDYTLDFLRSSGASSNGQNSERIVLDDFAFNTGYRVGLTMREYKHVSWSGGNLALFSTRAVQGDSTPYFTLFWIGGTNWRFDYNAVNSDSVAGAQTKVIYEIMADGRNGLWVNGAKVSKKALTYLQQDVTGKLEFFCANQYAKSMSNRWGDMDLFNAKVYASPAAGAEVLVNLVPMVKNGRAGLYDTIRGKYYFSDTGKDFSISAGPTCVEGENPFFATAAHATGAESPAAAQVFDVSTALADATSYTNAHGGVLVGGGALALTGANDWGGAFTVSNGTLLAESGLGLGAGDRIVLSAEGSYGGWNGVVTNAVGTGAGQISAEGASPYLSFTAADGDVRVNLGGKGEAWRPTEALCRLRLNFSPVRGVVYFDNPIVSNQAVNFILRNNVGESVLTQPYLESDENLRRQKSFAVYGNAGSRPGGNTTTAAPTNAYSSVVINSGGWTFGENTTNTISGQLNVLDGSFLATNAVVVQTGVCEALAPECYFKGGTAAFVGGSFTTGSMFIGAPDSATKQGGALVVDGDVRVKKIKYTNSEGQRVETYGTPTIRSMATSAALTLKEHANMVVQNFRFNRRNIYQEGGKLHLNGGSGILEMGANGTARYNLNGGRLEAPFFQQHADDAKYTYCAQVYLNGGTFAVTEAGRNGELFRKFGPSSGVYIGSRGGTIETDYAVSATPAMRRSSEISGSAYVDSWPYEAAQYMTAPALTKTGSGTLTLMATSSYLPATDVAAGTLRLADGAALPTGGVVRVTGGVLDLGGNVQRVKALCGTGGEVVNGAVEASEGIAPGGFGAVGSFRVGAALSGALVIDLAADGTADSLVTTASLDLANLDLVIQAPDPTPAVPRRLKIVTGPFTGAFKSVGGLPNGWRLAYGDGRVTVGPERGLLLIVR